MHSTILMTGQIKRSKRRQPNISPPLHLKRAITTASATDSSTASSIEDAGPEAGGKPQQQLRDESCKSTNSSNLKSSNRNRPRKSVPFGVSFGDVRVRLYDRSIGDWWDIQHGLCLGWEYEEMPPVPLPEDEGSIKKSRISKAVKKTKAKVVGFFLVTRHERNSMGIIRADSIVDVDVDERSRRARIRTKSKVRMGGKEGKGKIEKAPRKLSYEDSKPSAKYREALLKDYGFTSAELDESEMERKLLRLEYSHWTRASQNPSNLFVERCLGDIRENCACMAVGS